jgi:hypothetical protein
MLVLGSSALGERQSATPMYRPSAPPRAERVGRRYQYRETYYQIAVRRTKMKSPEEYAANIVVDGVAQEREFVLLIDDRKEHQVEVLWSSRPNAYVR